MALLEARADHVPRRPYRATAGIYTAPGRLRFAAFERADPGGHRRVRLSGDTKTPKSRRMLEAAVLTTQLWAG